MTNWVYTTMTVSGSSEDIKAFKERYRGRSKSVDDEDEEDIVLDNDKIIPYPEEYRLKDDFANKMNKLLLTIKYYNVRIKDGYNNGGYEWCNTHWGTKWGICHSEITSESEEEIVYHFETAWSPATPMYKKMSLDFPKVTIVIEAEEEGNNWNPYTETFREGVSVDYEEREPEDEEE